jgi:hypothetical protein
MASTRISFYLPSVAGVSRRTYTSESDYSALFTGNPPIPIILHFVMYDLDLSASSLMTDLMFNFTFHCELFDRLPIASSALSLVQRESKTPPSSLVIA